MEIIWGWQERTFSRSFCGIGQQDTVLWLSRSPSQHTQRRSVEPSAYFTEHETLLHQAEKELLTQILGA